MQEPDCCWNSSGILQHADAEEWPVSPAWEQFHSWLDDLARELPKGLWQPGIDGSPEWCAAHFAEAELESRAATDNAVRQWSGILPWPPLDEQAAYWIDLRLRVIRWFWRCATPVLPGPQTPAGAAIAWPPPPTPRQRTPFAGCCLIGGRGSAGDSSRRGFHTRSFLHAAGSLRHNPNECLDESFSLHRQLVEARCCFDMRFNNPFFDERRLTMRCSYRLRLSCRLLPADPPRSRRASRSL